MSDDKAMEQRLRAYLKRSEIDTTETSIGWALAFAFEEVRAALAPREQSPGLAEAERTLRGLGVPGTVEAVIVAEIDRLRSSERRLETAIHLRGEQLTDEIEVREARIKQLEAEVARLSQPAPAQPDELARLRAENAQLKAEMEDMVNTGSKHDAFMARLQSAVEPLLPAPAHDRATRVVYVKAGNESDATYSAVSGYGWIRADDAICDSTYGDVWECTVTAERVGKYKP